LIVSSPYVRASQTASILAKELKYKEEIAYSYSLVPMGESDDMIEEINEIYLVEELMLVGHEPSLGILASVLLAGNTDISITFKKGGVCCLSVDNLLYDRKAVLEWLVTPNISTKLS
jgi:phosphohistidine phosphatase